MDTEYLKRTVGDALTRGLTEISIKQPNDAIEYLANFLLKYIDNEDARKKEIADLKLLQEQREQERVRADHAQKMKRDEEMRLQSEATERAAFEEEEREKLHKDRLQAYEEGKKARETELTERRIQKKKKTIELTPLQKARARFEAVKKMVGELDPDVVEEMLGFTPETHPNETKVIQGVLCLLGHSPNTVRDWEKIVLILGARGHRSILQTVVRTRPQRLIKPSKLKRARIVTKGINVKALATSNFAAFLLFEWLDLAVDLRNETVTAMAKKETDETPKDRLLPDAERVAFKVGEPGRDEEIPAGDRSDTDLEDQDQSIDGQSVDLEADDDDDDDDEDGSVAEGAGAKDDDASGVDEDDNTSPSERSSVRR